MSLKNMKIKIIVVTAVILSIFLAANTILAAAMNITIINVIGARAKTGYAYSFVPVGYKNFIYIRNFQNVRSFIEKSGILKEFKNNYLLEDFKSRYYQNFELFFIKLDFNLIELTKNIKDDLLVGTSDDGQYMTASIDFSTKVIFSILNMLPADINETAYAGSKYYSIMKNETAVFYAISDEYVMIANSEKTIKDIIDAAGNKVIEENLSTVCQADDIYFKNNIKSVYNKYDLLPEIADLSLKINIKSGRSEIKCSPSSETPLTMTAVKDNYEVLKMFPMEMPLFYANNNYKLKDIIDGIYQSTLPDNVDEAAAGADLSVLDDFSESVMIGYNSLDADSSRELSPEICFVLNLKQIPSPKDLDLVSDRIKNVVNAVIGTKKWNISGNPSKNYRLLREKQTGFNIIVSGKSVIIAYGNDFADQIISQISASRPSFYDKFFKGLSFADDNPVCYSFINTETLVESIEPSLIEFLNSSLSIDNDEYDNSFGQVFDFIKRKNPISIKLFYDKNKNIYYGNTEFLN